MITGMMTFNCNVGPALLAPGDTDRDADNGVQTAGSIGKDALFCLCCLPVYPYLYTCIWHFLQRAGAGKIHTAFDAVLRCAVPCVWQLGQTLPRVGAKFLVQPLVWLTTRAGMHLEVIDLASEGDCWELRVLNQLSSLTSPQATENVKQSFTTMLGFILLLRWPFRLLLQSFLALGNLII